MKEKKKRTKHTNPNQPTKLRYNKNSENIILSINFLCPFNAIKLISPGLEEPCWPQEVM